MKKIITYSKLCNENCINTIEHELKVLGTKAKLVLIFGKNFKIPVGGTGGVQVKSYISIESHLKMCALAQTSELYTPGKYAIRNFIYTPRAMENVCSITGCLSGGLYHKSATENVMLYIHTHTGYEFCVSELKMCGGNLSVYLFKYMLVISLLRNYQ